MARVVLNTFGSLGDLHPYLAIAIALKQRGHAPVVATSEIYRGKVEGEGVGFYAVRPNVGELLDRQDFIEKLWHPRLGTEHLFRDYLLPALEAGYEDLLGACRAADLVLTHAAALAGPIAAERLGIPWAALVLQPITFLSTYDPPVIAPAAWLRHLYPLGRFPFQAAMALGRAQLARWAEPMVALRKRVGLPTTAKNPLLVGQFSDYGTLALFSRAFATPQPDWPSRTCQTGFVFYDRLGIGLAPDANGESGLKDFLDEGPEPVLFTLGSSAVMHPGQFYSESVQAAQKLGVRAVLLVGPQAASDWNHLPSSMYAAGYVPFSEIMPRCAVTVHQGGIGTTAQALRAGRPTLVVPWAHDQPDNAERLRKIGVSRTVPRAKYRAERIARELDTVLKKASYAEKARTVADQIAKENGTAAACDAIESLIASSVLSDALCGQRPDSQRTPR